MPNEVQREAKQIIEGIEVRGEKNYDATRKEAW